MTPEPQPVLTPSQGAWAVSYARDVVDAVVKTGQPPERPEHVDDVFEINRGAFVTLRKEGTLRGCIGRPTPEQSAIEAIREAAVDAATDDPRFPPVKDNELSSITVEVSVLTPPDTLETVEPASVSVGKDGLIVKRGGRSGLLLPQVPVDRGWDAERFLQETCRKAGLQPDCWDDSETTFHRFQAQVFEETVPYGSIKQVELADPTRE